MPPLTPLVRPDRFFAERDLHGLRVLAVVVALAAAGPLTAYGVGWILTVHVDGTVLVDNPERPPDWVCEDETGAVDRSGCDRPRRVERGVDSVILSAVNGLAVRAIVAGPFVWLLTGVLLHAGSWLAGGEGGSPPSFAVAAWGLVPSLVAVPVMLLVIYVAVDPVTVTPGGDTATALDPVWAQIRSVRPVSTAATLVTAAWSAAVWRYGLEHERGLSGRSAWVVAGAVAALLAALAAV